MKRFWFKWFRWLCYVLVIIAMNWLDNTPVISLQPMRENDDTRFWLEGKMTEPFLTALKEQMDEEKIIYSSEENKIYVPLAFFDSGWFFGPTSDLVGAQYDAIDAILNPKVYAPKLRAWIKENNWSPPKELLAEAYDETDTWNDPPFEEFDSPYWNWNYDIVALAAFGHRVTKDQIHAEKFYWY